MKPSKASVKPLDLGSYVPFYFTVISNKLTHSASRIYRDRFGIGIVEWRVLCTLSVNGQSTAQDACQLVGIDKAAASRAIRNMEKLKLIKVAAGKFPGRNKPFILTPKGQEIFDQILPVAFEREDVLLRCLSATEKRQFINFLQRIHENLPNAVLAGSQADTSTSD